MKINAHRGQLNENSTPTALDDRAFTSLSFSSPEEFYEWLYDSLADQSTEEANTQDLDHGHYARNKYDWDNRDTTVSFDFEYEVPSKGNDAIVSGRCTSYFNHEYSPGDYDTPSYSDSSFESIDQCKDVTLWVMVDESDVEYNITDSFNQYVQNRQRKNTKINAFEGQNSTSLVSLAVNEYWTGADDEAERADKQNKQNIKNYCEEHFKSELDSSISTIHSEFEKAKAALEKVGAVTLNNNEYHGWNVPPVVNLSRGNSYNQSTWYQRNIVSPEPCNIVMEFADKGQLRLSLVKQGKGAEFFVDSPRWIDDDRVEQLKKFVDFFKSSFPNSCFYYANYKIYLVTTTDKSTLPYRPSYMDYSTLSLPRQFEWKQMFPNKED